MQSTCMLSPVTVVLLIAVMGPPILFAHSTDLRPKSVDDCVVGCIGGEPNSYHRDPTSEIAVCLQAQLTCTMRRLTTVLLVAVVGHPIVENCLAGSVDLHLQSGDNCVAECSGWASHSGELLGRLQLLHLCVWPDRRRQDLHYVGSAGQHRSGQYC